MNGPEATLASLSQNYSTDRNKYKDEVNNSDYPNMAEPALIHPLNNSIVKIRNTGMIDIFTGEDQGIRIDPTTKTINLTAGRFQEHGGGKLQWLDWLTSQIKGSWTVEVQGSTYIRVGGNSTIKTWGDANISANGRMNVHADQDMRITSGTHIYMDAPEIDIN